jgi:amino acid adenylation domain-containing protein
MRAGREGDQSIANPPGDCAETTADPGERGDDRQAMGAGPHADAALSASPSAAGGCLHHLIEEQARRTPDSVAIVAGDVALDYRTLDWAANDLAHRLAAEGLGPEDRVGVIADRSADTVIALLGVLKAGAAYVPIDPGHPEERRVYLLEDAGVDIVVAPAQLLAAVPVGPRRLVSVGGPGASAQTPPVVGVRPDNLAYILYTSGSTGAPKGVMVTHRQLLEATRAQRALDRPWPEAFLMPISFSFDASGVGLYWTLSTGGCLVIPADGEHRDPQRLRELAQRYGATHSDCTPALYDLILGTDANPLRTMRCVIVGGEMCPPELVARHRALLPGCLFENNYGPTEVAVWALTHLIRDDTELPAGTVPIGYPIPGINAYLLGESLVPAGHGERGELYIGGTGVARG